MKIRWIALLLALLCVLPALGGCAADTVEIMRYGESSVSVNMYRYWLASYKGNFMYTFSDATNTDAFWDTVLYDDVTAEEYLNEIVVANVKRTLLCMELFRQKGMKLPASVEEEIDTYIDELIKERAGGSKNVFNEELAKLGINVFWHTVVGDNPQRLRKTLELARSRADIIITTGGLGPTCDDLTKNIIAEAMYALAN